MSCAQQRAVDASPLSSCTKSIDVRSPAIETSRGQLSCTVESLCRPPCRSLYVTSPGKRAVHGGVVGKKASLRVHRRVMGAWLACWWPSATASLHWGCRVQRRSFFFLFAWAVPLGSSGRCGGRGCGHTCQPSSWSERRDAEVVVGPVKAPAHTAKLGLGAAHDAGVRRCGWLWLHRSVYCSAVMCAASATSRCPVL